MKISQDEVVDNQTTLRIELEEEDLAAYLEQGYRRIAPRVAIPGFRRGKVPRRVVEGYMGRESLLNEVLDSMVYESTDKAAKQNELDFIGRPKIEDLDLDPVSFTAVIALKPDVALGDYRSISVEFEMDEITDQDVTDRIDQIRESLGTWETVERAAEMGDLVNVDARGYVDGEEFWSREDGVLYLAEDGTVPVPGFPQEIVGVEPGRSVEFSIDVPEDFRDSEIAGKTASFEVTVSKVDERTMPVLDDEFAQGLPDGFESVDALRAEVERVLREDAENRANQEYESKVIEALLDQVELTIPPIMLEHEAETIQSTQDMYLERANIRKDDYLQSIGKTEEEVRQEAEEEANNRIMRSFVLDKVAEIEEVEATPQQIDERFNQMYAGQPMRRPERRERRESVERMLKYENTVSLLVGMAKGESETENAPSEGGESASEDAEQGEES